MTKWRGKPPLFDTDTLFGFIINDVVNENGKLPTKYDHEFILVGECGRALKLYHRQNCCESVSIEDIVGDLSDLKGAMITKAEEVSHKDIDLPETEEDEDEWGSSETWTYYNLTTSKGHIQLRWLGSSNGYYSERVDISFGEAVLAPSGEARRLVWEDEY